MQTCTRSDEDVIYSAVVPMKRMHAAKVMLKKKNPMQFSNPSASFTSTNLNT